MSLYDGPPGTCEGCQKQFFKSHGRQKYCTANNFACRTEAVKQHKVATLYFKKADQKLATVVPPLVGGGQTPGRGLTRALLDKQDWRCAACAIPLPTNKHPRHPRTILRVALDPPGLLCEGCYSMYNRWFVSPDGDPARTLDPRDVLAVAFFRCKSLMTGPAMVLTSEAQPRQLLPARKPDRTPEKTRWTPKAFPKRKVLDTEPVVQPE